jgi:hypothetical protein
LNPQFYHPVKFRNFLYKKRFCVMPIGRIERLECTVKNYAWGKLGEQSEVARLFAAGHPQAKIGQNLAYAELWIGTHPDGGEF